MAAAIYANPQPSAADEARLEELYRDLAAAKRDLSLASRAWTNGIRYRGADPAIVSRLRADRNEAAVAYNAIVAEINQLTAPYRAAARAAKAAAARVRRLERQAAERAAMRAAACEVCGTIHAGEC